MARGSIQAVTLLPAAVGRAEQAVPAAVREAQGDVAAGLAPLDSREADVPEADEAAQLAGERADAGLPRAVET